MLPIPMPVDHMVCQLYNYAIPMPITVGRSYGVPAVETRYQPQCRSVIWYSGRTIMLWQCHMLWNNVIQSNAGRTIIGCRPGFNCHCHRVPSAHPYVLELPGSRSTRLYCLPHSLSLLVPTTAKGPSAHLSTPTKVTIPIPLPI